MSFTEVVNKPFSKSVAVPTSKSYANRLLILASVVDDAITIKDLPESTDVTTMINCLQKLGVEIHHKIDEVVVVNSFPKCEKDEPVILDSGDGGTTNRFLIPLLSLGRNEYLVRANAEFLKRPMEPLFELLRDMNVQVGMQEEFLKIQGPIELQGKNIVIDSSQTTQFASGLLLSLFPLGVTVYPKNMESSSGYWEQTTHLVEQFKNEEQEFVIPVDFSSVSYPLALGLTCGEVVIRNCHYKDKLQSDSVILDIIERMGGKLEWRQEGLLLSQVESLQAIAQNCSQCLDLVPTLIYLCSCATGKSILTGLKNLTHKESDRLQEIKQLLELFEVDYQYDQEGDQLVINGDSKNVAYKEYDAPNDHRMIMAAYLFMRRNSGGKINNVDPVSKSYPKFFEQLD